MNFMGMCVGGPCDGEWRVCEAPCFRVAILPELVVEWHKSPENVPQPEIETVEYCYDGSGLWRVK